MTLSLLSRIGLVSVNVQKKFERCNGIASVMMEKFRILNYKKCARFFMSHERSGSEFRELINAVFSYDKITQTFI